MKTTAKALLDLYVKLGGSLTDTYADIDNGAAVGGYTTIPDCIEACAKKAGGSITVDSDLSDTSTNPVQNRTINSALVNLGNTSPLIVTATLDLTDGTIKNATNTVEEVVNAGVGNRTVLFCLTIQQEGTLLYQVLSSPQVFSAGGTYSAKFVSPDFNSEEGSKIVIISASSDVDDGEWKISEASLLPPYSTTEAGKVLSVNSDGELEWVTP